jgi:hypothetical protein
MNFRVGQKVVCVDASEGENSGMVLLRKGAVYTVAEICPETRHGHRGLYVVEVSEAFSFPGFKVERFRPAVERKTGISVFTKILDDVSRKVPADAVH